MADEKKFPDVKMDLAKFEVPKIELPKIDVPKIDMPKYVDAFKGVQFNWQDQMRGALRTPTVDMSALNRMFEDQWKVAREKIEREERTVELLEKIAQKPEIMADLVNIIDKVENLQQVTGGSVGIQNVNKTAQVETGCTFRRGCTL